MLSLKHSTPQETIPLERMKILEDAFEQLLPLFESEEYAKVPELAKTVWERALQIYNETQSSTPFYILFMTKSIGDRFQEMACGFLVDKVKCREPNPPVLKDCLVWFCDKSKGIFELETCACDSRSVKYDVFPCLTHQDPF